MEITHPFHPLRGQRFRVLKRWRYAARSVLILEGTPAGTYAIPAAWTSAHPEATAGTDQLSPDVVVELQALLSELTSGRAGGVDGGPI